MIEIREYANGKFQVWRDDEVLRPKVLEFEGGYQSKHDFMFFDSLTEARLSAIMALRKEEQNNTVIATHSLYVDPTS